MVSSINLPRLAAGLTAVLVLLSEEVICHQPIASQKEPSSINFQLELEQAAIRYSSDNSLFEQSQPNYSNENNDEFDEGVTEDEDIDDNALYTDDTDEVTSVTGPEDKSTSDTTAAVSSTLVTSLATTMPSSAIVSSTSTATIETTGPGITGCVSCLENQYCDGTSCQWCSSVIINCTRCNMTSSQAHNVTCYSCDDGLTIKDVGGSCSPPDELPIIIITTSVVLLLLLVVCVLGIVVWKWRAGGGNARPPPSKLQLDNFAVKGTETGSSSSTVISNDYEDRNVHLTNGSHDRVMTSPAASAEYYNIKTAADISNINSKNNKPADNNPYYNIFQANDRKASYVNVRSLQNNGGSEYYNV